MGYQSALKKEGKSDTRFNLDEPWTHYGKWSNKPDTSKIPLERGTQSSQIHRENRTMVANSWWAAGNGSYCFMLRVGEDEKFWRWMAA